MLKITFHNSFKKDFKRIEKRKFDLQRLKETINIIAAEQELPQRYKDHFLIGGEYAGCHECHIASDWLLVYRIEGNRLILNRTGTHSDIF